MKTAFSIAALAVILSFSSCGKKGLSDELKGQLHTFEADWKATGEAMTNYGATMNKTFGDMRGMMDAHQEMPAGTLSVEKAAQVDSMMGICNSISKRMEMINTSYTASLAGFAEDEAAYKAWKGKIQKKEIKEADAGPGLNDFNVKLAAYKDNMESWSRSADELHSRCAATCKAMESIAM